MNKYNLPFGVLSIDEYSQHIPFTRLLPEHYGYWETNRTVLFDYFLFLIYLQANELQL